MKINSTQTTYHFKPGQVIVLKNFKDSGVVENAPVLKIDDDVEILVTIQYIIQTESHIEIGFLPVEVSYVSNMAYMILKTVFFDSETEFFTVDCAYIQEYIVESQEVESAMKVDVFVVE
ncbi:hypothetical protein M595_3928 [Lyngbya aestuarii BL J]|uniref:Uncharacterized protein n=1 Tax=Lyngbya aestuarii BL J TaxID=1348334 RepID=U7QE07_9CYAN|nr:hypothetical protein [Lyngbya aestuarii]ERT06098.1 hypothetical protein M595_3928 [Lyngbya aestuarii BL J]